MYEPQAMSQLDSDLKLNVDHGPFTGNRITMDCGSYV